MKTLREKIEGLRCYSPASAGKMADKDNGRWIFRTDVLRIIDEHEAEQSAPIVDMTPGGLKFHASGDMLAVESAPPVGQAGGEEFREGIPCESLREAWSSWETKDGPFETFPPRSLHFAYENAGFRPRGRTWSEVEEMAKAARPVDASKPVCPHLDDCECDEAKCDGCGGVVWLRPDGMGACPMCNPDGQPAL